MSGKKQKILIIEDDKFLRELISRKLSSEAYEVGQAIDGEDGVKQVEESEEKPDLILLDLILPGMDGFEVLAHLKENEKSASIPVIILSNLGQKEDIEKGFNLGASDYLIKAHFTPAEIVSKVRTLLD